MSEIRQITTGVSTGRDNYLLLITLLCTIFLLTTGWFIYSLASEPSETRWGFLVVNFIFLLGVTQFGVAFSALMRICKANWSRSFYRIAELTTLAFFPFAIIGILYIYFYGSPHLFYWVNESQDAHLSPWLNSTFLLYRNILAQLVFYLIALVYFITGLLPDITTEDAEKSPALSQWLYKWLLSIKKNKDEATLKRNVYFYSPVILIAAVIANTFIAWDFGMMLVPHYHSSVFPMYFILGNMLAGTAFLLVITVIISRIIATASYFSTVQVQSLAVLITAFTLLWLYMFWAQFFVSWFGNLPNEYGVLSLQMYGHYSPYFWAMMICTFFIPIACLIFVKVKRTWWAMTLLAIIINIGIWLNRYLIVIPALVEGHHPFMSLLEVSIIISLISGFLLMLLIFINMFPMVSMWELRAVENE